MARRPILLFGGSGQLGRELVPALSTLGNVVAPPHAESDLARLGSVRDVIRRERPSIIVNAAALTNVDRSEREPDLAYALNDIAPGAIAAEARAIGAVFVHYSTDYVFDGSQATPYTETDAPSPINVYGASKLAGERRVAESGGSFLVLRTSWVYSRTGAGFVPTILRQMAEPGELRVVADQTGSPTWSRALATKTATLLRGLMSDGDVVLPENLRGVYHLGGAGVASRVEIANEIISALDENGAASESLRQRRLVPIRASEFGAAAPRPVFSALSNARIERHFGIALDPWRVDLRRMLTAG
ncbi:MAG TPA: dTDP-4-dehydrorhamnose reductase [Gemmatimonadaceae bacterium]|nr:dTDP-4-dehydrorhamnose reductase [Gemmatimonadaceae bacterium]